MLIRIVCYGERFYKLNAVINFFSSFFFNDTATTEIYTLSLHDALPILENLLDRDVDVVLDPTLILDNKEWQEVAKFDMCQIGRAHV